MTGTSRRRPSRWTTALADERPDRSHYHRVHRYTPIMRRPGSSPKRPTRTSDPRKDAMKNALGLSLALTLVFAACGGDSSEADSMPEGDMPALPADPVGTVSIV